MGKTNRSKFLIVLLVVCLAGFGLLGAEAWRIISERRGGALWHEQELAYISEGTPAPDVHVTEEPVDVSVTPEPEEFEDMEPIVFTEIEDFLLATSSPIPASTRAPEATAGETPAASAMPSLPSGMEATPAPGLSADAQAGGEAAAAVSSAPSDTPAPEVQMVGRSITSDIRYTMDFAQLSMLNEDVRGWLIAEDTILNYPVVQGEDNEYYLTHLFSGKQNKTGAVFMDCGNSRYFTDICTWLYAHNRQDDTMFAVIPEYADQAFFDEHPNMYLLTPYGDYLVQLFACIRGNITEAEKWHIKSFDGKAEFEAYVRNIRSQSRVASDTEVLWGDQLLAMSTCTNQVHEERYVLFGVLRPILYEDEEGMSVTRLELEKRGSYTKTVDIPGYGEAVYYAQNDPTWANMLYETRKTNAHRKFGTSGSGPTALAIAIANLTDDEQLSRLLVCPSSEYGFSLCTCSVNQYFCNRTHVQLRISGLEDLKQYLPVVLANFATGNNLWGVQSRSSASGTKADFFPYVANACNLDCRYSRDFTEMISALQNGAVVIAGTAGSSAPFTGGGHYVTILSMDQEYLYIIDPYLKEDYHATDRRHVLEVLEPGAVRVKWQDADRLRLNGFYILYQRAGYVPPES